MAQPLDPSELVTFKELLMANSMQMDAVINLLIGLGIITEKEFHSKLKEIQKDYLDKSNG